MSKEMISFPRELSDDLAEFIAEKARVCGGGADEIWEALCERFGQPAEQHQGHSVVARVCAYTPGMGQVELKLPGNLPTWLELGEEVTVLHGGAQHQGEPVGVMRSSSTPGIAPFADIWPWLEPGTKLYTRPGALPAAVVLPERMPTGNNVEGEHNRLSPGVREGWNLCLAEVARLNPQQ